MGHNTLNMDEARLLALHDCGCVMASIHNHSFDWLVEVGFATSDTVDVNGRLMNFFHISPYGERHIRQIRKKLNG